MYHPICSDHFFLILASVGMETIDLHLGVERFACTVNIDVAGTGVTIEVEDAPSMDDLHEEVLQDVRDQLFSHVEAATFDEDDQAAVLGAIASLDELIHGPSTGLEPGRQAVNYPEE